jgi:hypothetical protein
MAVSNPLVTVPLFLRTAGIAYLVAGLTLALGFFCRPYSGAFFMHTLTCLSLVWIVVTVQSYGRASRSKTMRVGALLLLMGMPGLALEAFMVQALPSALWQSLWLAYRGLFWSFLVVFVVGSTTYSAGFYHIDATSPWAKRIFIVGLVWGVFGQLAAVFRGTASAWVFTGFVCWWALGLCWQGVEILTIFRYKDRL